MGGLGGCHPRNGQVTCSAARLSAHVGVLQLFLSPHSQRSLPSGHSHLHKRLWWGLTATQRHGQTNAAASQLLAKSPSPGLDGEHHPDVGKYHPDLGKHHPDVGINSAWARIIHT